MNFVPPSSTHPSGIAPVGRDLGTRFNGRANCIEKASVNIDAAISSMLYNLANILSSKEHHRTALKAFVGGHYVFALLPTGFGTSMKMTDGSCLSIHMQVFLIRPSVLKHLSNGAIPDGWVELCGTKFIWRESG